jgi:tRNA-specific 2-thiouridylase
VKRTEKKVFVGMSGGVDSSVAALLLKRQGYDVVGVFMRCYNIDGCAERDAEDARRVAGHLGIPFYVWDFEDEYKKRVVQYMIDGYRRGLTPNPDVECNREIKFGLFFDRARSLGADFVATGHYVRCQVSRVRRQVQLLVAKDKNKDQSYFLWALTQKQLAHCLFPIGEYTKPQVRAIARRAGLPTANKKDSQGICFLGNVSVQDFLRQYLPERRGVVLTADGRKVGEHAGAHFYTIGQRHGLGNLKHETGNMKHEPLYVAAKNMRTNTIVVAKGENNPALFQQNITLRDMHSIDPKMFQVSRSRFQVLARVRYRQPLSPAQLLFSNSRELENKKKQAGAVVKLVFKKPQKFVAPGQSAVFYTKSGVMLGGGIIV